MQYNQIPVYVQLINIPVKITIIPNKVIPVIDTYLGLYLSDNHENPIELIAADPIYKVLKYDTSEVEKISSLF